MERLLTYGLLGNELVHIQEVNTGLACNCTCPNCYHPLVAKNSTGNKKMPHFAHYSGKECDGAFETALHLLAKSTLLKCKKIFLPNYHHDYQPENNLSLFKKGKYVTFDDVILEKSLGDEGTFIIPDAIGIIDGKKVLIEFANTHFVDSKKLQKLRRIDMPCVEVNLANQDLDESELFTFFCSETPLIYWLHNPRLDSIYQDYKERLKAQEELLKKQKIELEQQLKRALLNKHIAFKSNKNYRILSIFLDEAKGCPLTTSALSGLNNEGYGRHNVLKRIINGEYWNGEFYGHWPKGSWIFIEGEKVIVYPPESEARNLSEQSKRLNKFLFAGLKQIKDAWDRSSVGKCKGCKHALDNYWVEDKNYQVCKYTGN
jgi:hypothetical protein